MKAHVNVKCTESDNEELVKISEKKKKEIDACEIELWKALKLLTEKLNTVKGKERETLLKEFVELRETIKFLYNDVTIAEDLYNECETNLKESKYESSKLLQCTSCQVLVLHKNK